MVNYVKKALLGAGILLAGIGIVSFVLGALSYFISGDAAFMVLMVILVSPAAFVTGEIALWEWNEWRSRHGRSRN